MREKRKKKIKQAVFETIGVLISFLVLIPFLMVLVNSMKSKRQANLLQLNLKGISLGQIVENYGTVIKEARLVSSFLNSAVCNLLRICAGADLRFHGGVCGSTQKNKGHEGGK